MFLSSLGTDSFMQSYGVSNPATVGCTIYDKTIILEHLNTVQLYTYQDSKCDTDILVVQSGIGSVVMSFQLIPHPRCLGEHIEGE